MKRKFSKILAVFCIVALLANTIRIPAFAEESKKAEALTEISFTDFGLANDTYTFVRGTYKEGASLIGTKLSGYITLNEDLKEATTDARLVLGGTTGLPSSGWDGVQILFQPDGKTVHLNQGSVVEKEEHRHNYIFSADSNEGLTTFAGEKFKLTVSFEPADLDDDKEKDDVLVKMYINDHLWVANNVTDPATQGADGSYYILNAKTENLSGYLASQQIKDKGFCSDMTLESYKETLTEISFTDFGLANDTYTFVRGTYKEGASLIGTKLSGYITLNEDLKEATKDARLVLGGTTGLPSSGWDGVQILFQPDGKTVHLNQGSVVEKEEHRHNYIFSADSNEGLTTFAGEKFKLTVSFEPADLDDDKEKDDVLVKMYINDHLWVANNVTDPATQGADGSYYILNAKTENLSGYLAFQQIKDKGFCSNVTFESISTGTLEPEPEPEPEPEKPVELTKLTFIDFELADNRYTSVKGTYNEGATLVGTEVSGYITLNENLTSASHPVYVVLGGTTGLNNSGWDGVQIQFHPDGKTVHLNQGSVAEKKEHGYNYIFSADSNEGLTTFAGEKFKLTVSFEPADLDDDKEKDDVLVKMYINDHLWVANNVTDPATYGADGSYYILNAKTENLQGYFNVQNICVEGLCSDIKLESLDGKGKEEIIKPALHKVTLGQLGITEALYKYNLDDLIVSGVYKDYLMNSTFSTKLIFSTHAENSMRYGGKQSAWHGVAFTVKANGTIMIHAGETEFPEKYWLTPEIAGTTLVGEEIDLKIELFQSGKDAKLGVYINGELYDGAYFHLSNAAEAFGSYVGFYVKDSNGSIRVGVPEAAPMVDQNFKQLTFDSYDIETGTYSFDEKGLAASGHCNLEDLNKAVFSDTVQFSRIAGAELRIGGKPSAWHGLILSNTEDGKLVLSEAEGKMPKIYFNSETAGTALVGEDVKLQMSFESVDCDGDGKKDDVKLGVWFNGKAYGDRWFYLQDMADLLGGYLGIYCSNEDAYLKIYTYHVPIDYTIWGFTKRWAYELGLRK